MTGISNPKKKIIHAIGNDAYNLRLDKGFELSNPFSHPRILVSSFIKAEKILKRGINEVHKSKLLAPSPIVIMNPMEKLEGGVTGAGAGEAHIHVGNELNIHLFSMAQVCSPESI